MTARILVVDDIAANLRLLEARLLSEYFDVILADTGMLALEICANAQVDLIILDVMMPGMSGFEVCETLKSDAKTAGIPIVFVTALNQPQDRTRAFDAGADDFFSKPVNDLHLVARVRNLLRVKPNFTSTVDHGGVTDMSRAKDAMLRVGSDMRVMIVGSNLYRQRKIRDALSDIYEVVTFSDPQAALFNAAESPYTLIIVVGDEGNEDILIRALDLGVDDCIVEPFTPSEIKARCRNLCQRSVQSYGTLFREPVELDDAILKIKETPLSDLSPLSFAVSDGELRVVSVAGSQNVLAEPATMSALQILREQSANLQTELDGSNLNRRLVDIFRAQHNELSSADNSIRLGLTNLQGKYVLDAVDADGEISPDLAGSLRAHCYSASLFSLQFEEWRRFISQAVEVDYSENNTASISSIATKLADDLDSIKDQVDENVPKSLRFIIGVARNPGTKGVNSVYGLVVALENLALVVTKYFADLLGGTASTASKLLQKGIGTAVAGAVLTAILSFAEAIGSALSWVRPAIAVLRGFLKSMS